MVRLPVPCLTLALTTLTGCAAVTSASVPRLPAPRPLDAPPGRSVALAATPDAASPAPGSLDALVRLALPGVQDAPDDEPEDPDGWEFVFTPYLWLVKIDGDVQVGDIKSDIDMSFGDILDNLEYGWMANFEARKGRWGALIDTVYMSLTDDITSNGVTVDWRLKHGFAEASGFYSLDEERTFDVILGVRRYLMKARLDVQGGGRRSDSAEWTDVVTGLRKTFQLGGDWSLLVRGDYGGWNIGGDTSEKAYQGVARVVYTLSETFAWTFGYRYMVIDYEGRGYSQDLTYEAAVTGLEIHF